MNKQQFIEKNYVDRKDTNSVKWDALEEKFGDPNLIPMWVADMDFKAPEAVIEAMKNRIEHGVFGYSFVPNSFYEAVIKWEKERHGYEINKEHMRISLGVVPALYWMINIYTKEDDAVMVLNPVYYPFHNSIKDNNRKLVACELNYDKGKFTINFDDFEKKIIENDVKLYIMCSPANPIGRVWTEKELDRMLGICRKHGVLVISDEIHQDIVFGKSKHIPANIVSGSKYKDIVLLCFSSSKTFNLASCLVSTIIIENDELREKWDDFMIRYNKVQANMLGVVGVEAALKEGQQWFDDIKEIIYDNYKYIVEELREFSNLYISPLEGTYLMFLDLREYIDKEKTKEFIQDKCRLAIDYGEWFGENYKGFVRLNIATHPDIIKKAVENIKTNLKEEIKRG